MSDITVHITSSLTSSERRITSNWSLEHLKERLETITGIPPEEQQLLLFATNSTSESTDLTSRNNSDLVSNLNISSGSRIQVNDKRPISELDALEDDSNVKTFELNDEEYDKRTDSVRRWKKDNQLGRFNPEYESKKQEALKINETKSKSLKVNSRFRSIDDNGERRGVIKYIGKVKEIDNDNIWVGVAFDEPVGKNDGSIKGIRYFESKDNYGGFLKPSAIEQGDFPEKDLFDDSDDEI